jgi:2-polyprenyl-3-methyl-5-hydroxy-6-metoxy-1,4-benzoquinol methylase
MSNETLQFCPACNHSSFTQLYTCKDFVASGELFELVRCGSCRLVFTNPRPDTKSIGRYYQTENYVSHAGSKKGLIYLIYDVVRNISLRKKKEVIEQYNAGGRLLDVGCGLGYFLNHMVKGGWDAKGLDVSEEARNFVSESFGLNVLPEEELDNLPAASYDVITMWHVLEHVHLLQARVKLLKTLLKKDGTLFIAVPNSDAWEVGFYKEFWDGFDVPRHLYHFNHTSIEKLMEICGLKVVAKKPMIFDSYYISWRSEIHKKNPFGFFRAMVLGQISNWKAKRNQDYSSVLYVIKHA